MAKYLTDIVDYFTGLCVNHPELAHDELAGKRVFEVISYEEAFGDFRSAAREKSFFVRFILPTMAFYRNGNNAGKSYQCGLMVGKFYSSRESAKTARIQAWSDAERIADDFIARMIYDSRAGNELFNSSIDVVDNMNLTGDFLDAQGDGAYAAVMYIFEFSTFRCIDSDGSGFQAVKWIDLQ